MITAKQMMQQELLDKIKKYEYIRKDGSLDLEHFCCVLSLCFCFDRASEESPQPDAIYTLLTGLIRESYGNDEAEKLIRHERILDWTPDIANFYPNKTRTCISAGALFEVSDLWISSISHTLLQIPRSATTSKYFSWVDEEWISVYAFINGYHNALYSFMKSFDRKCIEEKGYSSIEALHFAMNQNVDFERAELILKARHISFQNALAQIEKSITNGFYLEAIALEECLISNCISNYLKSKSVRLIKPSFKVLLTEIRKSSYLSENSHKSLFKKIDSWRISRNKAIHGYIEAASDSLDQSRITFQELSEVTAREGASICKTVISWYRDECINFIAHEFPSNKVTH